MLRGIVANFKDPSSFVQCRYAKEMSASIDALAKHVSRVQNTVHSSYPRISGGDVTLAKEVASAAVERIRSSLQAQDPQAKWLQLVNAWPRMTTIELLTELRTTSGTTFGTGAKEAIVAFGVALSKLQRILRIQDAQKRQKEQQEHDEWENKGHSNWSPVTFSDWLLLEIDGDILIREEQVQVALATVAPQSNQNSVLQLLMGKGKTSCILRKCLDKCLEYQKLTLHSYGSSSCCQPSRSGSRRGTESSSAAVSASDAGQTRWLSQP